jgi:trans-aconitate 2-methyltransferase
VTDAWDPQQYERFKAERAAPFADLRGLVEPVPGGRVVDLGCGTGELTATLATALGAAEVVGIDGSPAMLAEAAGRAGPGLRFDAGDIGAFDEPEAWDVVFSNAALHWVPDHRAVLGRWAAAVRAGGQLAVQVPANFDHPSHLLAAEVGAEAPFAAAFERGIPADGGSNVLRPEEYSVLLEDLGFARQHVRLQVYGHRLASTADVVEWVKGTALTRFERALPPDLYELFVERYRARLMEALGDKRPYFYPFKRVLLWGSRRAAPSGR